MQQYTNLRWPIAALIPILIGGCSKGVVRDSAPVGTDIDFSHIPDAVPRVEPRSRYGNPDSYEVMGKRYYVRDSAEGFVQRGEASWYGTKFHGRRTSSGEVYDMYKMTAAHNTLPLPTWVEVTNLRTGGSVVVKVNDRGPFHGNRIIDLSYAAAHKLNFAEEGTAPVEIRAIDPTKPHPVVAGSKRINVGHLQAALEDGSTRGVEENAYVHPATLAAAAPRQMTEVIATAPPVSLNTPSETPAMFLQVGAFSSRDNAERLRQRLSDSVSNISIQQGNAARHTLYRVRVGPLTSEEEIDALVARLLEVGIDSPRIVRD